MKERKHMDLERLKHDLKRYEGLKLKPYRDTVGKWTIGVGRNLTDVGISHEEAEMLLVHDIKRAQEAAQRIVPAFIYLNDVRQDVLINMVFNMGAARFRGFKKMLSAIEEGDTERVASEMLDSRWARQVDARATELAERYRTG